MSLIPTKRRILHDFTIDKIASVDLPCQEHAVATLIKRRADISKVEIAEARAFDQILAENEARELQWQAEQKMWPLFSALRDSLGTIAADPALDIATKAIRVQESVSQFVRSLQSEWPEVAAEIESIAKAKPDVAGMAAFIKAAACGDQGRKESKMPTDAEKIAGLEKSLDETTKARDEAVAKAAGLEAELAKAKAMPKEGEDWEMDGKPTTKGLDFIDKHRPAADEVLKVGDTEIRKSAVGEANFSIFKAQEERLAIGELAKRADTEFASAPGTGIEKAALMRYVERAPEAVRKTFDSILAAASKAYDAAFQKRGYSEGAPAGGNGAEIRKSQGDFNTKVGEIRKRDNCSRTDAMSKARREHPELFKQAYPDQAEAA